MRKCSKWNSNFYRKYPTAVVFVCLTHICFVLPLLETSDIAEGEHGRQKRKKRCEADIFTFTYEQTCSRRTNHDIRLHKNEAKTS